MNSRKCQCEQDAHFGGGHSPFGNPGHKYGQAFSEHYIVEVKTPLGTFAVCKACASDCLAEFEEVPR